MCLARIPGSGAGSTRCEVPFSCTPEGAERRIRRRRRAYVVAAALSGNRRPGIWEDGDISGPRRGSHTFCHRVGSAQPRSHRVWRGWSALPPGGAAVLAAPAAPKRLAAATRGRCGLCSHRDHRAQLERASSRGRCGLRSLAPRRLWGALRTAGAGRSGSLLAVPCHAMSPAARSAPTEACPRRGSR